MIIALYFGSFNPLHIGHISIAKYILDNMSVDQVHLVPSPQNPLKPLLSSELNCAKLEHLKKAVIRFNAHYCPKHDKDNLSGRKELKINDIEYRLKPPYYTYNTLMAIKAEFTDAELVIVIGADNLDIIEKWYKWKEILANFRVWVYPRSNYDGKALCIKYGTQFLDAPLMDISSTFIREEQAKGVDMSKYTW